MGMGEAICVSYLTENKSGSDSTWRISVNDLFVFFFYKMSTRWTGHHTTMTDVVFKRAQNYNSTLQ